MDAPDLPPDPEALLAALRTARRAMISVLRSVRSSSIAFYSASMVVASIDAFGTVLTGKLRPFATGGSVGPDRAEEVRARQAQVER